MDTIGQDTVMAITLPQLLAFSSFSVILAVGQLLFKDAALRNPELTGIAALSHLLQDYLFWLVIALYGAATILWVYILQQAPLSRVYPITALAFVLVPLGAAAVFEDTLPSRYLLGTLFIVVGIALPELAPQ